MRRRSSVQRAAKKPSEQFERPGPPSPAGFGWLVVLGAAISTISSKLDTLSDLALDALGGALARSFAVADFRLHLITRDSVSRIAGHGRSPAAAGG